VRAACEKARNFALEETEVGLTQLRVLPRTEERELLVALVRGLIDRRS
jgi:hypothetical protein